MTQTRKMHLRWVCAAAILAATVAAVTGAAAQPYPNQDVHFICAFPPGSGSDLVVRYFADKMRPVIGRTIIVENKVGAGGSIAMEYAAKSRPDGYTVLVHSGSSVAANMHLYKRPPFPDAAKAIQVVATINRQPFMLMVDARSPFRSVADVTAAMKIKGEKASYATSTPTGTIMGEIYKDVAGLKTVRVDYRTASDSLNDLLSGTIDYANYDPQFGMAQSRAGRLRILGVSTATRLEANPDLPTMTEQGIPMDLVSWFAAMVPQGTPRPIVEQLNTWFNHVLATEETKKFLNDVGSDPLISTVDDAQAKLVRDVDAWREYMRIAKLEPQG